MSTLFEAYGIADAPAAPPPPAPRTGAGVMRTIADMGVKGAQGVVDLGQSVVGAASLASGGLAGKGMRAIGYDPEGTNQALGEYLSPEQREAEANVQQAEGVSDTFMAALQNPRAIAGSIAESLPSTFAAGGVSGMVARRIALKAAAPFGGLATKEGAAAASKALDAASGKLMWAGSGAEGAQSAGQIADQAQGAGRNYSDYALPSIVAGLGTAGIGRATGKVFGDAETALFTGAKGAGVQGTLPVRLAKSLAGEGTEEFLQSGQEQAMTNVAMGEPDVMKGVGNAAAMGAITGMAMGAGEGAISPHHAANHVRETETVPEVGTLSAAANLSTEAKAKIIENTPPMQAAAAPAPVDPVMERIMQLQGSDRTEALQAYTMINRPDVPKGVRQYNSKLLDQHLATLDALASSEKPTSASSTSAADLIAQQSAENPLITAMRAPVDNVQPAAPQSTDAQAAAPVSRPVGEPEGAAAAGRDQETTRDGGARVDEGSSSHAEPEGAGGSGVRARNDGDVRAPAVAGEAGKFATYGDAQAYISQQRRAGGTEIHALPLPHDDGTFGLALKGSPEYSTAEAFKKTQELRDAGVKDGDILTKAGGVFLNRLGASNAVKKAGDTHEVVPVKGGFVARLKDVQRFPENAKSLDVPRADMPQIKSEHHGALVNFLNARGVQHETVEVDPGTLKPTQDTFSLSKVDALTNHDGERSILVSSDNHVLDGHHQWIAAGAEGKDVKVIRLDKPIRELLPLVKEFPSAESAPETKPAEQSPAKDATPAFDYDNAHTLTREEFDKRWVADQVERSGVSEADIRAGMDPNQQHLDFIEEALEQGKKVDPKVLDGHTIDKKEYPLAAKLAASNKGEKPEVAKPAATLEDKPPSPAADKPVKWSKKAREAEAARAKYFTPGNIVKSYSGYDEVLAYHAPTAPSGAWSVTVHEVKKVDGKWVRQGKESRQHSTEPEAKLLAVGPVAHVNEEGDAVMFSRAPTYDAEVDKAIKAAMLGTDPGRGTVLVGETTPALRLAGLGDGPLHTSGAIIAKAHFDHGVSKAHLKQIPEFLARPVMVFKSDTQPGGFVVVTNVWMGARPLTIVMKPNKTLAGQSFNFIPSVYPREQVASIGQWIDNGLLTYIDQEQSPAWLSSARLQLPRDLRTTQGLQAKSIATNAQIGPDDTGQASLGAGTPEAQPLHMTAIEKAVRQLTRNWLRKPDIHVIASIFDAPEEVFRKFSAQASQGALGLIDGFHYRGGVYLVADMIENEQHAAQVLYHEALGHFGLRGVFGESLNGILDQLATARPALVKEKAKQYGLDPRKLADRRAAAEEVLAEMAQTRPELGFVQRVVTAVRAWLRANVPFFRDMKFTDEEIIANFILPARGFVERGRAREPSFAQDSTFGETAFSNDTMFSRNLDEDPEALSEALQERGEQIESSHDAERRWNDGEAIYALHEQAEEPHRVLTLDELRTYTPDQLMALPREDDTMFSRTQAAAAGDPGEKRTIEQRARELFNDTASTSKTFNPWNKSVGTQYQKAQQDEHFKRAFDATQDYILDVSRLANDAADRARDLLPRMDRFIDLFKDVPFIDKNATTRKDVDAISKPIFQGTLADKRIYQPAELQRVFGLSDKQVDLYKEFRSSVDKSLDDLTASTAAKILRNAGFPRGMIQEEVEQGDHRALADFARQAAEHDEKLKGTAAQVKEISDRAEQLKKEAYAPLMRFGQYAVSLRDPKTSDLQEFHLFESERKANAKARELATRGTVDKSVMSREDYKLLKGVSPESLEIFGDILEKAGLFDTRDEVFQEYLRKAIDQRSAMKRMIHREGYPGYSQDVRRVLATFVTSNARLASKNMHFTEMLEAVENIPKSKGDVRDEATKLVKYVQEPVEEAPHIRGLLFAQYIGGNIASALVNMTQSITMTLPYLSQFSNPGKAVASLGRAAKQAVTEVKDQELASALARAEQSGVVSPQEIHTLNASSMATFGSNQTIQKAMFLWGSFFGLAEQFNRRVAFIAAYETAKTKGEQDPYAFAVKAVEETQGVYNRGNRPNWARGAVGATLFTFKQFSISYLEFLTRLPAREKALALAILFLASGAEGMPFSDDIEDVIDTIAQRLGYNFNSKLQTRRFLEGTLGQGMSDFLHKGVSSIPGMPIDIAGRMGMANLVPGTGVLRKDTKDHMKDVLELAGPLGSAAQDATKGEWKPLAIRNLTKGADMFQTGLYRDEKGRKVIDTDAVDATWKSIGFQPAEVARESFKSHVANQQVELYKETKADFAERLAQARFEEDNDKVQKVRDDIAAWNERNPEAKITVTQDQVRQRLREMHKTREERIVKSAPKDLRSEVRAQLQ